MDALVMVLVVGGIISAIGLTAAFSHNRDLRRQAEVEKAHAAKS